MFFKKSSIDTISVLLKKGESIEGRISLVRYLGWKMILLVGRGKVGEEL